MQMQDLKVGCVVVWVDAHGVQHDALVTAVWGKPDEQPCINLVYVDADAAKHDNYGRQIARQTSVVYRTKQAAHGWYYMLPGETPNPVAPLQS